MHVTTRIGLSLLVVVLMILVGRETIRKKSAENVVDGCAVCHQPKEDPSPSHPVAVFGCSSCHLGNSFARRKDRAHMGLAVNPGDLNHSRLTCGRPDCHPDLPSRVEKSLMATNRGILAALQNRWPHLQEENVASVVELLVRTPGNSMALDHYRKMCGGCHLWKKREPAEGEIGKRGGGCTNCHILELKGMPQNLSERRFEHPKLTTRIPNESCLKCHNRSARNALSYLGRFESEGYGTPFKGGEANIRRLSGGRFYIELHADIHKKKCDMDCIDCHTERGLMGDGNSYTHMEEQVDISCRSCHDPREQSLDGKQELAGALLTLNGHLPPVGAGEKIVYSKGGSPLYHVRSREDGSMVLYRKRDGKEIEFKKMTGKMNHQGTSHSRLSCQACHSRWIPQCYGCHVAFLQGEQQKDWLTETTTPGRWVEGRSYLRFRKPTLGVNAAGRIGPFAPGCQVFLDVFDEQGRHVPELSFKRLTMAGFDPHTTSASVPGCTECHLDPKILGLGEGALEIRGDRLLFEPVYDGERSGLGIPFALDAFVSPAGVPLQNSSRAGERPFTLEELLRITGASQCIFCHDSYDDPIYSAFQESLAKYNAKQAPCWRDVP